MRNLSHKAALRRNGKALPPAGLPLFAWAEAHAAPSVLALPPAARLIARRYALSPSIARHVAELAGFAVEENLG